MKLIIILLYYVIVTIYALNKAERVETDKVLNLSKAARYVELALTFVHYLVTNHNVHTAI